MKKQLFLIIFIILPMVANADAVEIDGIYYTLIAKNDNYAEVTKDPNSYTGNIAIPESVSYNNVEYSVTSIGSNAFRGCSGLTSVTIPNSVTSIGNYAFDGCSSLTSVNIPNSVTSIRDGAFSGCSGLTTVTIPNSVTSIGAFAFYGCSSLTSVTIPNSVTSIGVNAFNGCSGLTSVTIGNSVTSIGVYAFFGCSGLTSVTIPNSVTSIGWSAFDGCSGLTSVNIPNSVTSIGSDAFRGCSGLTSITIPNSVTSIGDFAFYGCSSLTSVHITDLEAWCKIGFSDNFSNPLYFAHHLFLNGTEVKDLVIPNGVTSIGQLAFDGCSGLTSITIGNSVTTIGSDAFRGCSGLTSITIGNSVTTIGDRAFKGCSNLLTVNSKITEPFNCSNVFDENTCRKGTLYIPEGTKDLYVRFDGWREFLKIEEVGGTLPKYSLSFVVDNKELSKTEAEFGSTITPPTTDNEGNSVSWYTYPATMPTHDLVVYGMSVKEPEPEVFAWLTVNDSRSGYTKIKVKQGAEQTLNFTAEEGWKISNIFMDGRYVTSRLAEDGTFVTPVITGDTSIIIVYEEGAPSDARAATRSQADIKVVSDGIIISNTEPQSRCIIYGSDGQQVVNTVINDGTRKIALQQGQVYILTINGRTLKFAL